MSKKIITCIRCKRKRFHYAKGLCASCYTMNKYPNRNKKWRKANLDKSRKYMRDYMNKWYVEHPEKYEEHKEKMRKKMQRDYKEDPKKFIKRNEKWRKAHG